MYYMMTMTTHSDNDYATPARSILCSEGTEGPSGKGPFGKGPKAMWLKTQRYVSHSDFLYSPFA